jgi:uncharacterized protein (TIGR03083 family)
MDDRDRIDAIRTFGSAFAAAAREAGPDLVIPTCPEWTMSDLLDHVAYEYAGWYYYNLTHDPAGSDLVQAFAAAPPYPEVFDDQVDYLEHHAARFADRAAAVDLDADVWAFGSVEPARWWLRQAVMEVGMHTWDATAAVDHPSTLTPAVAVETVDQFVVGMTWEHRQWVSEAWPEFAPGAVELPTESFGLRTSDTGDSWLVHGHDGRVVAEAGGAEAGAAVRAPAEALARWVWGRPAEVSLDGEPDLVAVWASVIVGG